MKVNYNKIIRAYEAAEAGIAEMSELQQLQIALEASTEDMLEGGATNGSTQNNNDSSVTVTPEQKSKFIQFIQKVIEKIESFIENARRHISNKMKLMWTTNKGFERQLARAKATAKPLQGFKAIVYTYDDNYLERTMTTVIREFQQKTQEIVNLKFDDENGEEVPSSEDAVATVLEKVAKDKENNTIQGFIREMIEQYRGEKKEVLFNQSQIPVLERTVTEGSGNSAFGDYIDNIEKSKDALKTKRSQLSGAANSSTETIRKLTAAMTTVSSCYNAAISLSKVYYELKVERYLSAREVLRKFYQF